jgi:hypothetical protein
LSSWIETNRDLADLAQRRLFFIGGAPRSGTTWLQQMLDAHPDVSCRGEGLYGKEFAVPLERLMAERRQALEAKNQRLFQHTGGYPLPGRDQTEFLLGTAILLGLRQQCAEGRFLAVGEKTPENVFLLPRIKRLFPAARLIAIARDPRDLLASAWHVFQQMPPGQDEVAAKIAFIRSALPSLGEGARATLALCRDYPDDVIAVTYEALRADPGPILARLFRFLGVSDAGDIVDDCLARTDFTRLTGGRPPGVEENGAFLRKGVVGDWPSTLTPAMNDMVLRDLGWMFPHFGWRP